VKKGPAEEKVKKTNWERDRGLSDGQRNYESSENSGGGAQLESEGPCAVGVSALTPKLRTEEGQNVTLMRVTPGEKPSLGGLWV